MYRVIGPKRTRTLRVLWMLEELEQNYDFDPLPPGSAEVLALNPSGKVPVFVAEGTPITDSAAILGYLADKHGQLTYAPGTIERAQQDALTHQILDEMDAILWTAARHSFVLPEDMRLPEIKSSLRWEFAQSTARITERLRGPWLMGEMFTTPDILLTHCLSWARSAKFEVTEPDLLTYLRRATERPAYQAALTL